MSSGATAILYAGGVRVADGSVGDDPRDPTALSGLELNWGRSTTVDQPETSILTFDVADVPGGRGFRDVFATGTDIRLEAAGLTFPGPTLSTFPDPGFEAAPPNVLTVGGKVTRSTRRVDAGTYAALLTLAGSSRDLEAIFAPLPFVPAGTDPAAWDAVPRSDLGQAWNVGARIWAPPGTRVALDVVYFAAPWSSAYTIGPRVAAGVGAGAYATLTGSLVPPGGYWLGVRVSVEAASLVPWNAAPGSWDDAGALAGYVWDDLGGAFVDNVAVICPAAGISRTVLVFSGRVTDQALSYPDGSTSPLLHVTAADFTADLDNSDVGDEPWLLEPMGTRFARIVGLAAPGLPYTIDPTVSPIPVSWRDVDSQGASTLLAELATSVDGIMWAATHSVSGPYLDVEDPGTRPPDHVLQLAGGVIVIVDSLSTRLELSACDLDRDGVTMRRDVGDVVTRAAIGWLEQIPPIDDQPATTAERTHTLIDANREALAGRRRYGVSTQLTTDGDAASVAGRILDRTALGWRVDGLHLSDADTEQLTTDQLLTLLDGTSRNGLPLALVDLPDWSPLGPDLGVFLEGGTYRFLDGWWDLDLTASTAPGRTAYWNQIPAAWTWNQVDPAIRWDDVVGVGVA